jgi:hypothetical protein
VEIGKWLAILSLFLEFIYGTGNYRDYFFLLNGHSINTSSANFFISDLETFI